MDEIQLTGYIPGAIGRIAEMHAVYYAREWDFGKFFEIKVATELSEFIERFSADRDGLWIVSRNGGVEGSLVIDGIKSDSQGAHLRWFIISSKVRGQGWGRRLMETAVDFCREKAYPRIYLWTFEGLQAARHLYEAHGFVLAEEHEGTQWGTRVKEQKFVLDLNPSNNE